MGILVIKLKAIKYKENSFCYLSSYSPNFGLQAVCFLTLSFRPYAFKTFICLAECICLPKPSRILNSFYNLNPDLLNFSLTPKNANIFCSKWVDRTPGSRTRCVQQVMSLSTRRWFQRPKALYRLKTLFRNHTNYWPRLGLAIKWPSHWLANCKALKRDLNSNGIQSRKIASQQMRCWWIGIKTPVRWRKEHFSIMQCKNADFQQ